MITDTTTRTRIDEIAHRIYRISVPVPPHEMNGGFTFNQYLVAADEPLLFHTGMKSILPLVQGAIETVMPVARLRYIGFSHVEADECGALNALLALAPDAVPVGSIVAANISLRDLADRPARGLAGGEVLDLGSHRLRWIDAPHVPHNWETGYFHDETTATLFCGDLFTHGGHDVTPVTADDILHRAERFRLAEPEMGLPPSYSLGITTAGTLERIAALRPVTLACMHGSAWTGSGAEGEALLRGLSERLTASMIAA